MKTLLIDADSLCFHSNNVLTIEQALDQLEYKIDLIRSRSNISDLEFYLTEGRCLRYEIYPDYKSNRSGKERPQFVNQLKNHLKEKYGAITDQKWESDDLVLSKYRSDKNKYAIASIDKDVLKNEEGVHFNIYNSEWTRISKEESHYNFWFQFIVGDKIDGVPSLIYGLGEKRISRILDRFGKGIEEMAKYICVRCGLDVDIRHRLLYCGVEDLKPNNYSIKSNYEDIDMFIDFQTRKWRNVSLPTTKQAKKRTTDILVTNVVKRDANISDLHLLNTIIDFGKYKGKPYGYVATTDMPYIRWLSDVSYDTQVKYISTKLSEIRKEFFDNLKLIYTKN